ncbi:GNAT family N-acetyltransferase [Demequina sp. NBRC 110053]|uniref:GNAT family N-acetyltransferase n=1 Tax=Demequina sp. NBRC 110053 TaxID=1570342 RepID=UPI0013565EDB|nr:GNAT family N-acetyltransferase [Demequina sp. NBRC 110053]
MDGSPVDVRAADPADAALLASMLADFNVEFDSPGPDVAILAPRYERLLAGPDFWAVIAGDPAVGFATVAMRPSVYSAGDVALLEDFFVRPEMRNRRVGAAMMEALLDRLDQMDAGALEVQVDEPDADAMRFYARYGLQLRDALTDDRVLVLWLDLEV